MKPLTQRAADAGLVIVTDTREPYHCAWDFAPLTVERAKLDTGDYSVRGLERIVCVERKTAEDYYACLFGEWERFKRELERMAAFRWACVVVEADASTMIDLERRRTLAHPNAVMGRHCSINVRQRVPVQFLSDRLTAQAYAKGYLLRAWEEASRGVTPEARVG